MGHKPDARPITPESIASTARAVFKEDAIRALEAIDLKPLIPKYCQCVTAMRVIKRIAIRVVSELPN